MACNGFLGTALGGNLGDHFGMGDQPASGKVGADDPGVGGPVADSDRPHLGQPDFRRRTELRPNDREGDAGNDRGGAGRDRQCSQ